MQQHIGTLAQLPSSQQVIEPAVGRDQPPRIVVQAVDQDHAHAQLADEFLIERFEAAVVLEADEQGVKLQVEAHRADPVHFLRSGSIAVQGVPQVLENVLVRRLCGKHRGNLEQVAKLVNLLNVLEGMLGDFDAAVGAALKKPFQGKNASSLANGVAGDTQRGGH